MQVYMRAFPDLCLACPSWTTRSTRIITSHTLYLFCINDLLFEQLAVLLLKLRLLWIASDQTFSGLETRIAVTVVQTATTLLPCIVYQRHALLRYVGARREMQHRAAAAGFRGLVRTTIH